ncbi:MAG TPA: HEAT repeat domain-containing protein [Terriglobales bacterium]|jgi:HEAT repeat protein|nr:HEAT repeat domain-containing protein [Terriglobales bacterium]
MVLKMSAGASIAFLALLLHCPARASSFPQSTEKPAGEAQAAQTATPGASKTDDTEPSTADLEEKSWRVLLSGLHNKRIAERTQAVKALSLLAGNHQALRFALRAMRDNNPKVRTAAASTLGELHAEVALPVLRAATSDKDPSVMLAATHALYILKDPLAYEVYYAILMGNKKTSAGLIQSQVDRLKDPKQMAQMGFEEGIGFVPYAGMGYEAYRQLMKHDNSPVRAAAARFLALDPDSISEDALIQVADADKNIFVREAALDALAERSDPKCIPRLAINLDDSKYPIRYRTAATIILLGSKESRKRQAK